MYGAGLAVSFERIDPFVLTAARLGDETAPPTWIVCLADLLLVAEVLDQPHEFFAYAYLRSKLGEDPRFNVISEVDVLGAFLADRARGIREMVGADGLTHAVVGHHATDLNNYFTSQAMGLPAERPRLAVDAGIEAELMRTYASGEPGWADRVIETLQVGDAPDLSR